MKHYTIISHYTGEVYEYDCKSDFEARMLIGKLREQYERDNGAEVAEGIQFATPLERAWIAKLHAERAE